MDRWHSQWSWAQEGPSSENQRNALPSFEEAGSYFNEIDIDSPNVSKDDSIESFAEDHFEKSDTSITKPTFKSMLQAKKRLQAFSAAKQLKRHPSKDEKTEDADKSDKMSPKKSKKALYPLDKAQAVVQEIEEIKQKEAEEAQEEKKKIDAIMSKAYRSIALRARSRTPSPERENQFRKREIKSRNYRRSDSFRRRSLSPENYANRPGKLVYPQNWTEYRRQGLTLVKDEELKSKVFPKSKPNTNELVAKFLNFDGPSPLMDSFKVLSLEEKLENTSFSFLRITRSKPTLIYSVNNKNCKESFLTRKQLFHVISRDRRTIIEKLINSASAKSSQLETRTITSRPWYSRSWKRSADAECKILENSVGLSFLQTYSDEEEEEEEDSEEIIINNAKEFEPSVHVTTSWEQKQEVELCISNHVDSVEDREEIEEERDTLTPEEKPDIVPRKQNEEKAEETTKYQKEEEDKGYQKEEEEETTPERISRHQKEEVAKKRGSEELNETRKAIRELEEELERRKQLREEEEEEQKEVKKVKKKKKKKAKRKEVSSDSEEEERSKKKKKKKVKGKKKKYAEEDEDSDSSESDKLKKSKKKSKRKKEKVKKKKEKSKKVDTPSREHKAKKRDEEGENDDKKKKKSETDDDFNIVNPEEVKKSKKKSKEKDRDKSSEGDFEVKKKKSIKKGEDGSKKKKTRSRRNSSDFIEDDKMKDIVFEEYRKPDDPMLTNSFGESECVSDPPQKLDKDRRNDTSSERERKQKEHKKSRHDSEMSVRSDGSARRKEREFDLMYDDVKVTEKSRDKYKSRDEVKHKVEIELEKPYGKQSENRSSRSRDSFSKEDTFTNREDSKVKGHKPRDYDYDKPVCVKTEPDWENLRSKRNRHRHGDYKESPDRIYEEFANFPLEKEIFSTKDKDVGKREIGTPDTEEYRENWEKESDPIWESEEEAPTKARGKLNNSWESDEEIFERGHQVVESLRPISNVFDLEIPLNIKPFKRREIIDPDTELQLLKRESLSLDEERRRFEIEKQRVKELQLKVIKEAKVDKKAKRRRSKEREVVLIENTSKKWESSKRQSLEKEEMTPKKGRWDKKKSSPKVPCPKLNIIDISQIKREIIDDDSLTNVSSTTSVNNSAVLENEYEEFMKALTTTPKKLLEKSKAKEVEIISDNSSHSSKLDKIHSTPKNMQPAKIPDTSPISMGNQMHIPLPPTPQIVTILPKDIPLIPMPLPKDITPVSVKPVPVPSPQVEVDKIPKPLINLSLSANITLDIAPKFTTPPVDSPKISLTTPPTVAQKLEKPSEEEVVNIPIPVAQSGVENRETEGTTSPNKPFVFTSMVLASKRPLLNNSKLNLGDSDDEDKPSKSLKRLEEIVKENNSEDLPELPVEEPKELEVKNEEPTEFKEVEKKVEKVELPRSKSPEREGRRKKSPERQSRRTGSPKRSSHGGKKDASPRRRGRESPHRRRGHSPKRHSPRRRSSPKRRSPTAKRRHSPRRSPSPKTRRRVSVSPRRRSPRRSPSPKYRAASPKKFKSKTPETHSTSYKSPLDRPVSTSSRSKSPTANTSPLEGLKRSVADSTISDDLLPQPSLSMEDYTQSPVTQFYEKTSKGLDSPKREPLDVRINQALGLAQQIKEQPRHIPTIYSNYGYDAARFTQQFDKATAVEKKSSVVAVQQSFNVVAVQQSKSSFVQVGNMVQILPTEDIPTPVRRVDKGPVQRKAGVVSSVASAGTSRGAVKNEKKSQIVQVGNMLQIVPTDLPSAPPLPPEPKVEPPEPPTPSTPVTVVPTLPPEKQSAETAMRLKVAERREEREKRRQERERRRREKEKRRRDKERQRQIKLKQRTENMIKRALELEAEGLEGSPEPLPTDPPAQWPPLSLSVAVSACKEAGKSILVRAGDRCDSPRRKVVQFADGVRPGEGTSPSGGEELSSPPPRKKLPKEKRYKKTKLHKKNQKKKVKVKVIKKRSELDESDDDECSEADDLLPPPSPPPGSPPPHVFPPRIKPQTINALQPYLAGIVPVAGTQQQPQPPQQQLFRPQQQIGIVMHPHHHPPHHHGPPPPPPHHHHHHGPPPPPPHHHHGPPHFLPGPPPPPPHHHGPPPPPGFGRPRFPPFPPHRPPHHHHPHGPLPPFHH